ncbi:metalloregulator ArsR/SmtB family transcription factor [Clostridium sp. MCC353]|uniref:ArsR/SmtB family transcription factor n=1 Tax=Clostridium sp. MCC353 TaxID=2592646 RepID=UPI00207AAFE0|nr:metalloregulator ArsR/SmtB family transcription factor [Clostridium sp. MCC353]
MVDLNELQAQFNTCMPLFIALGDEVRLTIIEALTHAAFGRLDGAGIQHTDAGIKGMNVMEITKKTNLSRPAISHHLKILKDAGLVGIQKDGTSNYYYMTVQCSTEELMKLGFMLQECLKEKSLSV